MPDVIEAHPGTPTYEEVISKIAAVYRERDILKQRNEELQKIIDDMYNALS